MDFSAEEIRLIMNILDKGFRSGLFTADEAVAVSPLYQKLKDQKQAPGTVD
jgi:hypothetical protein